MRKKIVFSIIIILILSISGLIWYKYNSGVEPKSNTQKSNTLNFGTITSKVTKKIDEVNTEVNNSKSDKKEEKKINQSNETNTNIEDKKDENNNYYESNNQSNATYEEPVYTNPEPQVTERHIWDELGISEYDYYNSPMSSWQTVNFKVSDYGSLEEAESECKKAGLEYEPYINGEESFNCDLVTSYSGNYLGYMFYTKKTN